ncbi:unnamed protein product [Closterium sp. NIES-53]
MGATTDQSYLVASKRLQKLPAEGGSLWMRADRLAGTTLGYLDAVGADGWRAATRQCLSIDGIDPNNYRDAATEVLLLPSTNCHHDVCGIRLVRRSKLAAATGGF